MYKQTQHKISLTALKKRQKAQVVEIDAGRMAMARLRSLGIRPGVFLDKISVFALKGPVTIRVGHATIALGHGMAEKVIVELVPHY